MGTIDTVPAPAAASLRLDAQDDAWPQRPLLLAGLTAIAGAIVGMLGDQDRWPALIAAMVTAAIGFALTLERRWLWWAAGFALLWGAVVALVTHHNLAYSNGQSLLEWPFWSALLATAIAAPFFQSWRDGGGREARPWHLPYAGLHTHAWNNAVIGGAALAFVGLSWLLVWLVAEMFDLIGIDLLEKLLGESWFALMLIGAAFGAAVGNLRERDRVVAAMQRLVTVVLGVLAPLLAGALLLFMLALISTGLTPLWRAGFSTAALMLGVAAFCELLVNAVIGNSVEEAAGNRLLTIGAAVLAVMVLPLSVIAVTAMALRIGDYGWTPDRIWGLIAALVAVCYGVAGLWAVARGRRDFADVLRPVQQLLALSLLGLTLLLALPIFDFGAISARDQVARLAKGMVTADKFDYAAMAFDFGPAGRRGLEQWTKGTDKALAGRAKEALVAKSRYEVYEFAGGRASDLPPIAQRAVLPAGAPPVPSDALTWLDAPDTVCDPRCAVRWLDDDTLVAVRVADERYSRAVVLGRKDVGWTKRNMAIRNAVDDPAVAIDTRTVARRQLVINGKPVGDLFE